MGSSQSKNPVGKGRHQQQQQERYEQESILAAIAVNKRQRKLLLKQVKLAKQHGQAYSSHANLPLPEQPMFWANEQQNYQHLNGTSHLYNNNVAKIGTNKHLENNLIACYSNSCQSLYRGFNELGVGADDYVMPRKQRRKKTTQLTSYRRQAPFLHEQPLQHMQRRGQQNAGYSFEEEGASLRDDGYAAAGVINGVGIDSGEFVPDKTTKAARSVRATKAAKAARPGKSGRQVAAQLAAERLADPLRVAVPIAQEQQQPLDTASAGAMALKRVSRVKGGGKNLQQQHNLLQQRQQFPFGPTAQAGSRNPRHLQQVVAYPNSISIGSKLNSVASQSSSSQYSSQSLSSQSQYPSQSQFQSQSPNLRFYHSAFDHNQAASQQQQQQHQNQPQMSAPARYERGLAYSEDERRQLGLLGLLPSAVQDLDLQVRAVMNFIELSPDELSRYVYLRQLKDYNERLFYATLQRHVERLMPIVYTPTVGLACQKFSEIYMRPRGLYVRAKDLGQVASLLANWPDTNVRVIVVTDGERILGLGDLGANGMGISIGKLSLYTALAGIPPENVLPVTLDVGTNNESLLKNPLYIGVRENRLRGATYEALLDEFMDSVATRWGRSCLIQFEDFANSTAFVLLNRYRQRYCTFNDDIQGTASVCLSGLLSAAKLIGRRLTDCSFLFYGAGEANLGTAHLLVMAMSEEGASPEEARKQIWLIDSKGLVVKSRTDLGGHKQVFAQNAPELKQLEQIIEHVKPAAIIGASAQGGAFNELICKKMAEFNERPIIFALSNPTSKAECTAEQAYRWTQGRCVFASGSPFEPVVFEGKTYITGQGNNAYIFPGVGLAAIAAHVHTIPEDTFLVAARALSDQVSETDTAVGLIYPRLSKIRDVTLKVATRVLEHFYSERLATYRPEPDDKMNFLKSIQYNCQYNNELDLIRTTVSLGQMSLANASKANGNLH